MILNHIFEDYFIWGFKKNFIAIYYSILTDNLFIYYPGRKNTQYD